MSSGAIPHVLAWTPGLTSPTASADCTAVHQQSDVAGREELRIGSIAILGDPFASEGGDLVHDVRVPGPVEPDLVAGLGGPNRGP